MPIKFFPTLNAILTNAIEDICDAYQIDEDEAVEIVRDFILENSAAYYRPDPNLKYDDPLCRIAYLYMYVGAHANLIDNAFYKFRDLKSFVKKQIYNDGTLHICSFGGGPGSELLGFVKFIERERLSGNRVDMDFVLVDNITQWDETWQALVDGLETTFRCDYGSSRRNWPIVVHRSFLSIDLTKRKDILQLLTRFNNVQIYILNHTVSELLAYKDKFTKVFKTISARASDGAYFLFIDRNQAEVVGLVDRLIVAGDLEHLGTHTERKYMDLDEQKIYLGKWYLLMGRDPKVSWNAFYTLAQKWEPDF